MTTRRARLNRQQGSGSRGDAAQALGHCAQQPLSPSQPSAPLWPRSGTLTCAFDDDVGCWWGWFCVLLELNVLAAKHCRGRHRVQSCSGNHERHAADVWQLGRRRMHACKPSQQTPTFLVRSTARGRCEARVCMQNCGAHVVNHSSAAALLQRCTRQPLNFPAMPGVDHLALSTELHPRIHQVQHP